MTAESHKAKGLIFRVLTIAGLAMIVVAYFSPIWWVSLTAPQYPESAFPQGIRIHFHMDSVSNGCRFVESTEKTEDEVLNCKHEMDAINHYVGMYPIAAGGPVERAYSPFLIAMLALMLGTFMIGGRKRRAAVFGIGSAVIIAWMTMAMQANGGIHYLSPNYVKDFSSTMGLYPEDYADWSGLYTIEESYHEALGRYFREEVKNAQAVALMMKFAHGVYWGIIASLAALTVGLLLWRPIYWLLVLIPAAVPAFFVVEYAAWLWWFGHSLHEMGAFTVKPFMPTVLGQGKVAQFSTYSYPHYGFGLLAAAGLVLLLAMLIRRKQLQESSEQG
ncbi:MAG: hypothetical protein OQJ87_04475 [Rhodospirillales bacterium]|nr:hypothetical protein [Rhodospirillales bacterium]MCW8951413.1 hypothetical protein [Rhodospirillales bacterium]MCW8970238.1 hypothetical protein [Rhodospirillales bacterium]MCW9001955.1 hypothetical protein [Rhodospirillales bacterium]